MPDRPRLVLLCPKFIPASWWFSKAPPKGVGLIHARFIADKRLRPVVHAVVSSGTQAIFVGDMDPVGIAQYLAGRRMLMAAGARPLLYGGINDSWLIAMQASMARPVSGVRIRLERAERRLLGQLEDAIRLDAIVGPNGAQLLRTGYKVELEAGLNPTLHGARHRQWVFRYLRAMARRTTGHESGPRRGAAER
jgi:hypothetical protein